MKRIAVSALAVLALCALAGATSFAAGSDGPACHHGIDAARGKAAAVSDPARQKEAYRHIRAAYNDEMANDFSGCLSELKAANALMQ